MTLVEAFRARVRTLVVLSRELGTLVNWALLLTVKRDTGDTNNQISGKAGELKR